MRFYKYGLMIFFAVILVVSSCKKLDESNSNIKNKVSVKKTTNTNNKASKNKGNLFEKIEFSKKMPKFETSNDAVKLRYKFKVGKKVNIVHFLKMSVRYNNNLTFMNTYFYGYYEIKKKLKDENYELDWVISRITTELKVKDRKGQDKILKYDSESKENTFPHSELLKTLIKTSIKAKVDSLGTLSDLDLKSILNTMTNASEDKLKKEISQKAENFVNISVILLPKNDIKVGDNYYGREDIQNSSMLKIKSKKKYTVDSISKDKKFVVLKPSIDFKLDSSKQNINIKKNNMTGWVLFDMNKGFIKESYTHTRISMKINKVDMKMDMKSSFKVIE